MFCKTNSAAQKSYRRDVQIYLAAYIVLLLGSTWMVKHGGSKNFMLYFWSVLPALPVLGVLLRVGRYLREEKDEYVRSLTVQTILVGTGVLLAAMMVSDFLRAFANTGALPPFVGFLIFCGGMAATQLVQWVKNRVSDE
jgi:peptidoglycan/LPS O-acetylase OafA/YrhL